MTVETLIEDARWTAIGLPVLAERSIDATLAHLGLRPEAWEVALLGCGDARMAQLNADFRAKARPTNVLSWPSEDRLAENPGDPPPLPKPRAGRELGDLAIAFETCKREAVEFGLQIENHVSHLLVHGALHLLGYDHIHDKDAALMEGLEVEILATLGIPDPY